jgi:hypothetical protein
LLVKDGFSIVRYGTEEFVHILDREHHVSNWGDRVDAWRLDDGREKAGSGAGLQARTAQLAAAAGMGRGAGAVGARAGGAQRRDRGVDGGTDADDSDNDPLFPDRHQGCSTEAPGKDSPDRAGAAARAAAAGCNAVLAGAAPE